MIRVKIVARRLGISAVDVAKGEIVLTVAERSKLDAKRLVTLVTDETGVRVTPDHKIYAPAPPAGGEALFDATRALFGRLGAWDL